MEQFSAVDALSLEHDKRDSFGSGDIVKRISVHHKKISVVSGLNGADSLLGPQ